MENYLAILPEIGLTVLAALILLVDLRLSEENKKHLPLISAGGFIVVFVITILYSRPDEASLIWGGMLRHDWLGYIFRLVFLFGAAVTSLLSIGYKEIGTRGEFFILLTISTLGMNLMGASANLIMLFLAVETASIPLYVMSGFLTDDDKSAEAGFKYLLYGAMSSAVMLYGFSLLYGFGGTTDIYSLTAGMMSGELPTVSLIGILILILVGFGFKVSMVPFHFWAPDVYEGAPTPVAGFLSTASKAAGFSVILRLLFTAYPNGLANWPVYVAGLAALTMTLGNLVAIRQTNIKRLLAYSSIAHAGYILMGVAAASSLGATSVIYYIVVYLVTNLAAFGFVIVYSRVTASDEIADYAGLSRRHTGLAFGMLLTFLSLAGVPPLGGFIAKILVFAAAIEAGLVWLAVVGIINAIFGLYYYLIVLKVVYLYRSDDEDKPLPVLRPHAITLTVLVIAIVVTGTILTPWYSWAAAASAALPF